MNTNITDLPIEIMRLIAVHDSLSYRAMLTVPAFARSLNPGKVADYMVEFGYSVEITKYSICWRLNGRNHRRDGPAEEKRDGRKSWWRFGQQHRQDNPAVEWPNGHREWWVKGVRMWWLNNRQDRMISRNGPPIEFDGTRWSVQTHHPSVKFVIEDHIILYLNTKMGESPAQYVDIPF
jgi:hypothetical protein